MESPIDKLHRVQKDKKIAQLEKAVEILLEQRKTASSDEYERLTREINIKLIKAKSLLERD